MEHPFMGIRRLLALLPHSPLPPEFMSRNAVSSGSTARRSPELPQGPCRVVLLRAGREERYERVHNA